MNLYMKYSKFILSDRLLSENYQGSKANFVNLGYLAPVKIYPWCMKYSDYIRKIIQPFKLNSAMKKWPYKRGGLS